MDIIAKIGKTENLIWKRLMIKSILFSVMTKIILDSGCAKVKLIVIFFFLWNFVGCKFFREMYGFILHWNFLGFLLFWWLLLQYAELLQSCSFFFFLLKFLINLLVWAKKKKKLLQGSRNDMSDRASLFNCKYDFSLPKVTLWLWLQFGSTIYNDVLAVS